MANNYNVMAQYIVEKFIARVSGDDIEETFVEEAPEERVMVGMLAEDRMEQSLTGGYVENNRTRFESVPSMSADSFFSPPKTTSFSLEFVQET